MSLMGQMSIVIGVTTVGTQRAMREIQLMEATVKKAQVSMMQLGRSMTQFASLPAGIFAGAALANFAKFEFSIAKIVGLVGIADEQAKAWGKDVLNMSGDLGKGANELADALYYITSSGFKGAESMNILKVSAQAAASGLGETKQVADIVTSAMNAYGSSVLSAAEATNVLVMAVREGKGEPEDLTRAFATVIPISAKLGVQFHEVGGALASLTRLGMPAATAATYLRQTLFTLTKPSKQTRDALKAMGTSAGELRDSLENQGLLPTLRTLGDLTERFGEESMARVFPNIRAFMGVISLLQMDVVEINEVFENTKNSSNALNDAFAAASETLKFKLNSTVAEGQAMFIKFGEALSRSVLPIVESLGRAFKNFGDWFGGLSKDAQNIIAKILGITIAGGPLLLLFSLLKAGFKELKAVARYIFTGGWIKGINNTTNALNNQNNAVKAQTVVVQRQTAVINANTSAKVKNNLAQQALLTGNKSKIAGVIPMPVQNKATMAVKASMVANQSLAKVKSRIPMQAALLATEQQKLTILQNKYNSAVKLQTRLLQASIHTSNSAVTAQKRYESSLGIANAAAKKNNLTISMSRMVAEQRNIALLEQAAAQKMASAAELQAIEVGQLKNQVDKQANAVTTASIQNKALNKKATLLQIEATKLEAAAVKARNAALQKSISRHQQLLVANNTTNKAIREHHKSLLAQRHAAEKSSVVMSGFTKVIKGVGSTLTKVAKFIAANWMIVLLLVVPILINFIKKLKELKGAQKTLKDISDKVTESISSEKGMLEGYLSIAKNENVSKEERLRAIKELNKISPEYLGNIDEEALRTGKATAAINAYVDSLYKRLELEVATGEMQELMAKRLKMTMQGYEGQVGFWDKIKAGAKSVLRTLNTSAFKLGYEIIESPVATLLINVGKAFKESSQFSIEYKNALEGIGKVKLSDALQEVNEQIDVTQGLLTVNSSKTKTVLSDYNFIIREINRLSEKESEMNKKFANVTKDNKEQARLAEKNYQEDLQKTIGLIERTLSLAKSESTEIKEQENTYNSLNQKIQEGKKLTEDELQRLDSLRTMLHMGGAEKFELLKPLEQSIPALQAILTNWLPKVKDITDEVNDFLGDEEKLTDLQKLWKSYDESITAILNKQNLMPKYAKSFEPVEDALKNINTLFEGFTNLSSDSFKSVIGTKQAKDVIAYYNSLQFVKNIYETTQKSQEDLFKSLEIGMDSLYNDISTIDTFDEIMTDLGMNLSYLTVQATNMGNAFDPLNSKLTIYGKAIELIDSLVGFLTEEQKKLYDSLVQVHKALQLQVDSTNVINSVEEIIEKVKALGGTAETARDRLELLAKARRILLKGPKGENFDNVLNQLDELTEKAAQAQLALEMRNLKMDAIASFATLFGETIGKVAAGSKDAWDGLIEGLISIVKQIGSVLIGLGSWLLAIGLPIGANYLAAGIGITAIASFASASMQKRKDAKEEAEKTKVPGMALGGIVPPGYPNDSYHAMLTSGEAVIPAKKLPEFTKEKVDLNVTVQGVVRGSDLHYIIKEVDRKYKNSY